jgi:hypothetical protein
MTRATHVAQRELIDVRAVRMLRRRNEAKCLERTRFSELFAASIPFPVRG